MTLGLSHVGSPKNAAAGVPDTISLSEMSLKALLSAFVAIPTVSSDVRCCFASNRTTCTRTTCTRAACTCTRAFGTPVPVLPVFLPVLPAPVPPVPLLQVFILPVPR
jgi:hypothetical protein